MNDAIDKVFTPIFGEFTEKTNPTEIDYADESQFGNGGANIDHIYDYGTYYTDSTNVSVFEVVLSDNCQISRARKNIQNTVRKIMGHYAGAFIIFHYADGSNNSEAHTWRLSWLKRLDVHRKDSPAKRYTYLCGPSYSCRTIAQRLDELQKTSSKTLDSITKAFDVEALSDEFFKEYKVMYDDIVQWITGQRIIKKDGKWKLDGRFGTGKGNCVLDEFKEKISSDEEVVTKAVRDYVKKLLGRLVFIQFLQKKEWLKIDGTISSNFLLDLFNVIEEKSQDNFIEAALEKVVYLLLNNENREKDSEIIDHHKLDVPFLNGGLFERDQYDNLEIKLPKEFFHNETYKEEKRELSETRIRDNDNFFTQCGILDLFNQYNFTIDENDPNDAEVGVDPEMLGKIFENLLEDNKDKGAFYTPKEIVQYMCNESLIAYLQTKVPNYDDEIRQFVLDAEQKDVPEKDKVLDAIKVVKICDPAIGSGAFPMGLLNLLVALREKLESSTQRVELKKSIIQNNIYGVDIEKGAIDIARLRFWLSIMVDEEKPTPLPNFEYKFMQGNSLLTTFDLQYVDIKQAKENRQVTAEINKKKQELYNKKYDFYKLSGEVKYKKEVEIKLLIVDILKLRLGFEQASVEQQDTTRQMELFAAPDMPQNSRSKKKIQEVKAAQERVQRLIEKLLEIEKQLKDETKSWEERAKTDILFFDWEICFAEIFPQDKPENVRGFDIVIGNPPWGADLSKESKSILKETYPEIDSSTPNSYAYFIGWGLSNFTSSLIFVLPDSILIKDFKKTRKILSSKVREVIWYQNCSVPKDKRIFRDVEHDVCIVCLDQKKHPSVHFQTNNYEDGCYMPEDKVIEKKDVLKDEFDYVFNLKATSSDWTIASKLLKYQPLSDIAQCHEGIHSGNIRDKLFIKGYKPNLKPLFYGGKAGDLIRPYVSFRNDWYVDYRASIINTKNGEYASLRDERLFVFPKIYITRTGNPFKAFYDDDSYASNNFFSLQINDYNNNTKDNLLFLLPFINSRICQFFIRTFAAPRLGDSFIETKIIHLLKFPIPSTTSDQYCSIITFVNKILLSKKDKPQADATALELKIDILIYLLYGLTWDEVQVVENSSVHAALPVNEVAYTQWLERYQKDGTLPSEEEMEHMA